MTREEMHGEFNELGNIEIAIAIDKVIDKFESRTCETCKHSIISKKKFADVMHCGGELKYQQVQADFGCNKWEKRDD